MKRFFQRRILLAIFFIIITTLILLVLLINSFHDSVLIDYIISNDYSYVTSTFDNNEKYFQIESLPNSIDEEYDGLVCKGRLKSDNSKIISCYKYEYNNETFLKVIITDNRIIQLGDDNCIIYYQKE